MSDKQGAVAKIIAEHEAKGVEVIVLGAGKGIDSVRHIMEQARESNKPILIVCEDIDERISTRNDKPTSSPFDPEPFIIKALPKFEEPVIDVNKKPFYQNIGKKKWKPYMKNKNK